MSALLWCLLFLSAFAARSSLWENLQGGRKPRQRLGGIFHRQAAALSDALLVWFFVAFCDFSRWLYRLGAPAWLVELPRRCVPDALMFAAVHAFYRRKEAQRAGGQS